MAFFRWWGLDSGENRANFPQGVDYSPWFLSPNWVNFAVALRKTLIFKLQLFVSARQTITNAFDEMVFLPVEK